MPVIYSQRIRNFFPDDCALDQVRNSNRACKVRLNGFPPERIVISMDRAMKSGDLGRRGDYAVVADEITQGETFFIPMEVKSKSLKGKQVTEQIEGVITFFQKHLPANCKIYPLLVTESLRSSARNQLPKISVQSFKGKLRIKHLACGDDLEWKVIKEEAR
ncbi:MAG: hypothetical protein OXF42_01060 [Candidatus Dadabacteria bacterium]|nr:hypothetical protein [Candidatus Dadabacteria bacterium]